MFCRYLCMRNSLNHVFQVMLSLCNLSLPIRFLLLFCFELKVNLARAENKTFQLHYHSRLQKWFFWNTTNGLVAPLSGYEVRYGFLFMQDSSRILWRFQCQRLPAPALISPLIDYVPRRIALLCLVVCIARRCQIVSSFVPGGCCVAQQMLMCAGVLSWIKPGERFRSSLGSVVTHLFRTLCA